MTSINLIVSVHKKSVAAPPAVTGIERVTDIRLPHDVAKDLDVVPFTETDAYPAPPAETGKLEVVLRNIGEIAKLQATNPYLAHEYYRDALRRIGNLVEGCSLPESPAETEKG